MDLVDITKWVIRYGTQQDKERYRVVFKEIERLRNEVKKLKKQIQELSAPDLIPQPDKEKRVADLIEKTRNEIRKTQWQGESLPERLFAMKMNNQIDSELWNRTLKWNKLSLEKALELIAEFEKTKAQSS